MFQVVGCLGELLVFLVDPLDHISVVLCDLAGHGLEFHLELVVVMDEGVLLLFEGEDGLLEEPDLVVLEFEISDLDPQLGGLLLEERERLLGQGVRL